jgi:hypothetical protein
MGRIIPARVSIEKDDALCPDSATNVHFFMLRYDAEGHLVPSGKLVCQACGQPIKQRGARWVLDRYIISESVEIEDLL